MTNLVAFLTYTLLTAFTPGPNNILAMSNTWAIFGAVFQRFFKKYSSIINIIMALLLVYCAITLII